MKKISYLAVAVALCSTLLACGGGGGSSAASAPAATTPAAQGAYSGVNSAGTVYNALILDDGSFYSYYGTMSGNALYVNGVGIGKATSANSSWSVSYNDYQGGALLAAGTGSGTYTSTSLSGSNSEAGQSSSFTLSVPAANIYLYKTPAVVSSIVGSWSGSATDGSSNAWTVNANGTFTGMDTSGCTYSGTFTPRANGVNVFNLAITFGAAPCILAGRQVAGVALTYLLSNGQTEMVAMAANTAPALGIGLFGVR